MNESTSAKRFLDAVKFVIDIMSGIAIPVVLFVLTQQIVSRQAADRAEATAREDTEHKAALAKEQADREAALLLNIGPFLFDNDDRKVQFALRVLDYYKYIPRSLIDPILALRGSANPQISQNASQLLANSVPVSQLQAAAADGPELSQQASSLINKDRWMVYIMSGTNVDALKRFADTANQTVSAKNIALTAKVVGPGPAAPSIWGVVVGDNIPLLQAKTARDLAKSVGFADAYIIRAPGARE